MIKIAICDNNKVFLDKLEQMVRDVLAHQSYTLAAFTSAAGVLTFLETNPTDILITDIRMPEQNGIETAKKAHTLQNGMQFIFVSNYVEYIEDVFAVKPIFYLLKPIRPEKLKEALFMAVQAAEQSQRVLTIKIKKKTFRIPFREIQYLESKSRSVWIYTRQSADVFPVNLNTLEKQLPGNFVRCHKSFIVNMDYIESIANYQIHLYSGPSIPVAKSRYHDTKDNILRFWSDNL